MMDWTDRHCRFFHRGLTRQALLYTEMVTAEAILHGNRDRLLGFDPAEHPVALQLGGSDPAKLAAAARIGDELGYREINLNVGCPSDRVQSGRFGACLMAEPELVARCVAAMRAAVPLTPATESELAKRSACGWRLAWRSKLAKASGEMRSSRESPEPLSITGMALRMPKVRFHQFSTTSRERSKRAGRIGIRLPATPGVIPG